MGVVGVRHTVLCAADLKQDPTSSEVLHQVLHRSFGLWSTRSGWRPFFLRASTLTSSCRNSVHHVQSTSGCSSSAVLNLDLQLVTSVSRSTDGCQGGMLKDVRAIAHVSGIPRGPPGPLWHSMHGCFSCCLKCPGGPWHGGNQHRPLPDVTSFNILLPVLVQWLLLMLLMGWRLLPPTDVTIDATAVRGVPALPVILSPRALMIALTST